MQIHCFHQLSDVAFDMELIGLSPKLWFCRGGLATITTQQTIYQVNITYDNCIDDDDDDDNEDDDGSCDQSSACGFTLYAKRASRSHVSQVYHKAWKGPSWAQAGMKK